MTETLRCVAEIVERDSVIVWVSSPCGEPIRPREGGACVSRWYTSTSRAPCGYPADAPIHRGDDDLPPHHEYNPGYEHVSGDRGHPAKAPQEVSNGV